MLEVFVRFAPVQVIRLHVNCQTEGGFVLNTQTGLQFYLLLEPGEGGGEKEAIGVVVQLRV